MEEARETLVGEINEVWATEVATKSSAIWSYNNYNAEEINGQIPLKLLGGLTVGFDQSIILHDEAIGIAQRRSVVNLAFGEPGIATGTVELLRAAQGQRGQDSKLTQALERRSSPNHEERDGHGSNETWIFPLGALALRSLDAEES